MEQKTSTKKYKLVDSDLCGYGEFQYKVGETYRLKPSEKMKMCKQGFHSCSKAISCMRYIGHLDKKHLRLLEVEPLGKTKKYAKKYVSRGIKVLREITGEEYKKRLSGTVKHHHETYVYENGILLHKILLE